MGAFADVYFFNDFPSKYLATNQVFIIFTHTHIQKNQIKFIDRCVIADRFPARPYILDDYPKNVTVLENSTAQFSCPVIEDIATHITWAKYKVFNDTDGNITPTTERLEVNPLNNFGHSFTSWFFGAAALSICGFYNILFQMVTGCGCGCGLWSIFFVFILLCSVEKMV